MNIVRPWDQFSKEKLTKIFKEKYSILDIGGGLRINSLKGNRFDSTNIWIQDYLGYVDYRILDKVADFSPDIVGDIHDIPLPDASQDAVICIAVLEHVEDPQKALNEIYRIIKPGGYCYLYLPFLYYYHSLSNYYKDFYRFTLDGILYLTRQFAQVETQNVRGALATTMNMFPFFSKRTYIFEYIDKIIGKTKTTQTSGYIVFCVK